jgi:hypothetical protein
LPGERCGQLYAANAVVKREILRGGLVRLRLYRLVEYGFRYV